ncbi:glucose 1-dehydrogenase-like isoform X2 [Amphibalanus amphitrite]|uniref:glucose 1-dehydrogenase-like isoform X1 n=1 Tax=Amphibalanus amphitrite TaxID=1232801 RepID=UPI001C906B3A|nr:glucose 1-dehydrogenase-like isoform X1 [Amphibalanus amphitrite]XP_043199519.1 glucose 1-dehydrogenase-like isoform X1 [Amphibalanus amphitrite]XP_043199520.1 glucose 1-dehydrogenase-like isoform X2 [Amphibalanus amphitrite]
MPNLSGKVAIVTGASSGIGAATAEHFASLGARVVLAGRNEDRLKEVADKCHAAGAAADQVLTVAGDVCKEEYCQQLVSDTIKHFGQLDILVNSAGVLVGGPLESLSLEQYDKQMEINCRSVVCLSQLAIPHLMKTKGNIVNVSSVTGTRSFPGVMAYCMSKSAVDQLTRCAALELADRGVRVNAVNPGVIITELHTRSGMGPEKYKNFLEHCKSTHALGRPGEVMEVAKPIAFLASDDASFITGQTLGVDGGRGVMCPR